MGQRVNHQDMVKRVLDAKAVDFAAIGKVFAEVGPTLAVADEPWEGFCGTMRYFIRIFIIRNPLGSQVENLEGLRAATGELRQ